MSKHGTDESERQTVTCIGRGREGEGCGLVYGKSGSTCDVCGGMLLSLEALSQAELIEDSEKEMKEGDA